MTGDFWYGTAVHERWTAKREANAALRDPYTVTAMRTATQGFDFSLPNATRFTAARPWRWT